MQMGECRDVQDSGRFNDVISLDRTECGKIIVVLTGDAPLTYHLHKVGKK